MSERDDVFYARWILTNAAAEGIGLGSTLLLGHYLVGSLETAEPGPRSVLLGALLAVAMGAILEGAVVGWAQGVVIAARTRRIRLGAWTFATAAGAGIAWVLGMLPATVAGLVDPATATATADAAAHWASSGLTAGPAARVAPQGLPSGVLALLGGGFGIGLGVVLALPQWRLLHGIAPAAWRWLLANAAAWSIGMAALWIGMDLVPWQAGTAAVVASVYGVCIVAGTLVGAVHGLMLATMLSEADRLGGHSFAAARGPLRPRRVAAHHATGTPRRMHSEH